jgi:precorrin-2/cobalt-factor-2 C20-methyltransferase
MQPEKGRLYGIGVGPGDPELLTLKAHRILISTPVIAYPCQNNGKSVARAIVADFLKPQQIEVPFALPFSVDHSAQPDYDRAAEQIAQYLLQGQDVAVLCEGDPMLYGTFMYLADRLSGQFAMEIVPGISSTLASAAVLGVPLTYRNDVLSIIPATLEASILRDRLIVADAAIILKIGRHFSKVKGVLEELRLLPRALYIEHATLPNQHSYPIDQVNPTQVPYWSLIVIPSQEFFREKCTVL